MAPIRTLAVWCPDWPITAAGYSPDDCVAVLHANRVVACSAVARAEGIRRGIRKREAQSRNPNIVLADLDIDRDARAFSCVASAISEFTPRVEIIRPGICAIATRGPSRYFGGDIQLVGNVVARVTEVLAELHGICQVGIADGPFAAQLAARQSTIVAPGETPEFLAPLNLEVLEDPEFVDVLRRLGMRTLSDFGALPHRDVIARFGNKGARLHSLARGEDDTVFTGESPEQDWSVTRELEEPEVRADALAFSARQLASELHDCLTQQGLAITAIAIEAETENGESISQTWRAEHFFNAQAISDRTRWQLEGWLLGPENQRPTSGVVMIRLVPDRVIPNNGKQNALWGGEGEVDLRAGRAFTRLQSLFGREVVRTAVKKGSRQLNEQIQMIPWGDQRVEDVRVNQPWPGIINEMLPTVVWSSPINCEVVDSQNKSVQINGRGLLQSPPDSLVIKNNKYKIVAWAGPWPVDEKWWDKERHSRRAQFQIVTEDDRAYVIARANGTWQILGEYS